MAVLRVISAEQHGVLFCLLFLEIFTCISCCYMFCCLKCFINS